MGFVSFLGVRPFWGDYWIIERNGYKVADFAVGPQ